MIFDTGTIEAKTTTGGGLVNGIPQAVTESWGEAIPCHIMANMDDHKGTNKDGTFRRLAFTIWIDTPPYSLKAKRVRLTSGSDEVLGEFEVQSIEYVPLTHRTKITL